MEQTPSAANVISAFENGEAELWVPLLKPICKVDAGNASADDDDAEVGDVHAALVVYKPKLSRNVSPQTPM